MQDETSQMPSEEDARVKKGVLELLLGLDLAAAVVDRRGRTGGRRTTAGGRRKSRDCRPLG